MYEFVLWYKFKSCPAPIANLPAELSAVLSFASASVSIRRNPPVVILEVPLSSAPHPQ
jgi:hypothetical protein